MEVILKKVESLIESKKAKLAELKTALEKNFEIRQQADTNVALLRAQIQEINGAINALEELKGSEKQEQ